MSVSSVQCSVGVEDVFGPQVSECYNNFDFTLLFEESVLYLTPLLITLFLVPFRILHLWKFEIRTFRGRLWILKQLAWAIFVILQLVHYTLSITLNTSTTRTTNISIFFGILATFGYCYLSHHDHLRSVRPSTILTVYLLFTIPMDAVRARTLWSMPHNVPIARAFTAIVVWKFLILLLEAKEKRGLLKPAYSSVPPEETGGILNRTFFWWFNSLLLAGYKGTLSVDDLFAIDSDLSFKQKEGEMLYKWTKADSHKPHALSKVLLSVYKWPLLAAIVPRLCLSGLTYAQPFLVERVILFISEPDTPTTSSTGYGLIAAYAIVYVGIGVVTAIYQHKTYRSLTMVKGSLVSFIYQQTMNLSSAALSESASLTLMTTDVERVGSGMRLMHETWASMAEVGLALYLLQMQLGVATAAAIGVSLACIIFNIKLATLAGGRQKVWLEAIQKRIATTVSALGAMKGIKMTGSTNMIRSAIIDLRASEIGLSRKFRQLLIAVVSLSYVSTTMAPVFGFTVYSIIASVRDTTALSAATAYTSLTIFSLLGQAMSVWIEALLGVATAAASLERIREYLTSYTRVDTRVALARRPQLDLFFHHHPRESLLEMQELPPTRILVGPNEEVVKVRDASASWDENARPTLTNLNFSINRGDLAVIIGPIGCGKSTLLKLVLGEVPKTSGSVVVHDLGVAFCGQTAWLKNASIMDNIVGVSKFDLDWYNTVVNACALDYDFAQLPKGDRSVVGSKGIVLSGGQKTRVSLARTVYAKKEIAILDDVFCGLDAKTEQHVFASLFGPRGILKQQRVTTILATNSIRNICYADHIIALTTSGTIAQQGSYEELTSSYGYVQSLETHKSGELIDFSDEKDNVAAPRKFSVSPPAIDDRRRTGDLTIYKYYIDTIGWTTWIIFVFICMAFVFALIFPQFWIKWWTEANAEQPNQRLAYYLSIYAFLGVLAISAFVLACWHFMVNIVPKSAKKFHTALLDTVLKAPMKFFSTTDTGETSNRFSQDLELIDMELPLAIIGTTVTLLSSVGQLIVIIIGSNYIAATIPVLVILLFFVQMFYLRTSRQLRILDIEEKAPLLSHFLETIHGTIAIRAFGWTKEYRDQNDEILETSQRPYYLLYCAQRWLNLVLDMVVAAIAIILVSIAVTTKATSGALTGLALVNIVSFGLNLKGLISGWTSLEISMGAISRVRDFVSSTESEDLPGETDCPPEDWPQNGHITLNNISAAYKLTSNPVLKNISLDILPCQKVAVCGRTGSGKSTLVASLLRLIELQSGSIIVDGIDLSTIPRQEVRSRLITLPQEPFFLQASIRFNLDSTRQLSDQKLREALADVGLWDVIQTKGGLDAILTDDILSHGQRQLLCLVRAVLQNGKILILDEATSSLDQETDEMMQEAIRNNFSNHTVICVAHKLHTIMDFDHVIVLDEGRIVESGNPRSLALERSLFADMLRAANGDSRDFEADVAQPQSTMFWDESTLVGLWDR